MKPFVWLFFILFFSACEESLESVIEKTDALIKSGKIDEAIVLSEKAIQRHPKEITLYLNQAALYRSKQMFKRALRYYTAAESLNKESPLPLIGEARINMALGDFESSKTLLEAALKVSPNFPPAYFFMGRVYHMQQNGNQAVFYYNLASESKFDPLLVSYYRGQAYDKILKSRDQARTDYQAYIAGNGKKIDEVKGWLVTLEATPVVAPATNTSTVVAPTNPFDF